MKRLAIITMFVLLVLPSRILADDRARDTAKAEAGDFDAMLRVGLTLLSDAAPTNNEDGIKWLEMSSAGGNVTVYYNLDATYQDGHSVKHDAHKAIMYLTLAAELGEIRAMNRLAGIYYIGELVPANDTLAVKWGLCATGFGSETAKTNLEKMRTHIDQRSAILGAKMSEAWVKKRFPG